MLADFKSILETIHSYIDIMVTDMETDVVARFVDSDGIPLGYFYQGEYHVWEK